MLHRNAIATIIATAIAVSPAAALAQTPGGPAAPPAPPPPPPPIGLPAPPPAPPVVGPAPILPANVAVMAGYVAALLKHNVAGWQLAIAQNGKLAKAIADGTARTKIDNGGVRLKMKPTMRYELASLTKNFTAVSTMKLLRLHGLTIDSKITTYLPPDWKPSPSIKTLTFRQLLTHSSGIKQKVNPMTDEQRAALGIANTWDGLRQIVKLNVVPKPGVAYFNTNYALLRVLNARMWKASGGKILGGHDNVLPVNAATNARYAMDYLQRHVLTPSGIKGANCVAPSSKTAALNYYRPNIGQLDKGAIAYWPSDQCAGNAGLRLSSVEVVRYLAHLRHGSIIDPVDLAQMDALHLGWDTKSTTSVFRHGGDITISGVDVHTCGATFPDGTEAALIVNSPLAAGTRYQCNLLTDAWKNARP